MKTSLSAYIFIPFVVAVLFTCLPIFMLVFVIILGSAIICKQVCLLHFNFLYLLFERAFKVCVVIKYVQKPLYAEFYALRDHFHLPFWLFSLIHINYFSMTIRYCGKFILHDKICQVMFGYNFWFNMYTHLFVTFDTIHSHNSCTDDIHSLIRSLSPKSSITYLKRHTYLLSLN